MPNEYNYIENQTGYCYAVATLPTGYSVVLKKANGSHCEIGLLWKGLTIGCWWYIICFLSKNSTYKLFLLNKYLSLHVLFLINFR